MDALNYAFGWLIFLCLVFPSIIAAIGVTITLAVQWPGLTDDERRYKSRAWVLLCLTVLVMLIASALNRLVTMVLWLVPLAIVGVPVAWLFFQISLTRAANQLDQAGRDLHKIARNSERDQW